jgi:peptide/nickel transport system substrate-binding protein
MRSGAEKKLRGCGLVRTWSLRWSAVLLGGCLALAACGGGSGGSDSSSSGRIPERGGTLYLLMSPGNPGTLDPSQSYSGASENLSPLFISALTAYIPGTHPPQVTGDLATNTGIPSDGARVWTYHLKNVTYDNGEPVTSYDIKYDIERSFASSLAGGPPYLRMWLQGAANYTGPYVDKKGLSSVETPNAHTIIFKLNEPVGDFYYLATYPEFSGLPAAADTGVNYQYHMLTSGPYKIQTYVPDNTLVLVRNPLWKTSTDPYIKAYPDKIVLEEGLSPAVIDQRIIADNGPDQDAVPLDDPIQAADLSQVLANSSMRSRTQLQSGGGAITYIGLDIKKAPFNNLLVRQAVAWAVNKQTAQTALGGLYGAGAIANEILGPGISGYVPGNLYAGPTGNPAKAKALLAQAGYPHGISTTLGVEDIPAQVNAAEALQASLALADIKVSIQQYSASTYFTGIIGVPSSEPPMAISGWGSDWPNASTILPDLADGSQLSSSGPNNDITNFNSPAIDAEMVSADGMTDLSAAAPLWAKIDTQVMQQAIIIPLIYSSKVYTVGSNVLGASADDSFGSPNPTVIAVVSKPKSG